MNEGREERVEEAWMIEEWGEGGGTKRRGRGKEGVSE